MYSLVVYVCSNTPRRSQGGWGDGEGMDNNIRERGYTGSQGLELPYLLVFKPLGLIYEVGLRFEFKPPGAYKRNVLILHFHVLNTVIHI